MILRILIPLTAVLMLCGCSLVNEFGSTGCEDGEGNLKKVGEEWLEGDQVCVCDYPESYLPDPPPREEFSDPQPNCRVVGCVDRYSGETKRLGQTMYNEAFGVTCVCVEGRDPDVMDQGLPDLYHWRC